MSRINGYGPSLIVLATAATVLWAGPAAVRRISHSHTSAEIVRASHRLAQNTILEQLNQAYRDIAIAVEPSVVHISTEHIVQDRFGHQARKASSGSGWVYNHDGHVVTNHHVVEDALRIEVQFADGDIREAEVLGSDPTTDIAVLKTGAGQLHPATLRDPTLDPIRQGDMVFAFGSPFDFRFSMSSGVVSGEGRSVGVIRDAMGQRYGYENFIQVDAAINPGNSGGPLTDHRGHVIGMNTAIATGPRRGGAYDDGQFAGIGLAIPVDMIVPVVTQIIDNDGVVAKGYLGVSVVDMTNSLAEDLDLVQFRRRALVVCRVDTGHPAFDAGLRHGDVITHVRDQKVLTLEQLREATEGLDAEADLEIRVWRFDEAADEGGYVDLLVPGFVAANGLRGVSILQSDHTVGQALETIGFHGHGVMISRLVPDGPADRAGLERGDVIVTVNDRPVSSVQQLRSVISTMMPGEKAELTVWRYDPLDHDAETLDLEAELIRLNTLQLFGELPADQDREGIVELGIRRMTTSTRGLARQLDIEYHPGVIIEEIEPGSELSRNVEPGATIVEVMERQVSSTDEFIETLREYNLRRPHGVTIKVVQPDGHVESVRLKVR